MAPSENEFLDDLTSINDQIYEAKIAFYRDKITGKDSYERIQELDKKRFEAAKKEGVEATSCFGCDIGPRWNYQDIELVETIHGLRFCPMCFESLVEDGIRNQFPGLLEDLEADEASDGCSCDCCDECGGPLD